MQVVVRGPRSHGPLGSEVTGASGWKVRGSYGKRRVGAATSKEGCVREHQGLPALPSLPLGEMR